MIMNCCKLNNDTFNEDKFDEKFEILMKNERFTKYLWNNFQSIITHRLQNKEVRLLQVLYRSDDILLRLANEYPKYKSLYIKYGLSSQLLPVIQFMESDKFKIFNK